MEIRSIGSFLDYWRTIRGRTRRVVTCIPPDQIEWSPHPGKFTFGDLVRHLATIERYMYAETVAGDRKSTRLNSSHQIISYAVFCLKKKKKKKKKKSKITKHIITSNTYLDSHI